MTKKGFERLQIQLKTMKTVDRPQVIQDIAEARAHGDLSENAEYDAAKEHQGLLEARIADLENVLACAEVIDPATIDSDVAVFGATVKLLDCETDAEVTYRIVGDAETDPDNGEIGISTPVARAIMGKEIDDEVKVQAPGGVRLYEVLDISYQN